MALSDEDLAAMAHIRYRMEHGHGLVDVDDVAALERLMVLAGEPVPEPEPGSIWFDPRYRDAYVRNPDDAGYPWTKTGDTCMRWNEIEPHVQRRLVRLVREEGVDCGAE